MSAPPALEDPERRRLADAHQRGVPWWRWGAYLSERQWGTVREDYSANGDAWQYLTHDRARSQAYRWGEDGLLGITDSRCRLCFAVGLWNTRDAILKERLFGLSGPQGNHGEDVKEYYFYLDATPTHSYLRGLYKYPQVAFPYERLVAENQRRGKDQPEFELVDTGVFDDNRYFDVAVEYAKAAPTDLVIRLSITNRGPDPAPLHVLPMLWFRNTWSWAPASARPCLRAVGDGSILAEHPTLGTYRLTATGAPRLLFTENESNAARLWQVANQSPYVKDGFHAYVVQGQADAVNPAAEGTKAAAQYVLNLAAGATQTLTLRLAEVGPPTGVAVTPRAVSSASGSPTPALNLAAGRVQEPPASASDAAATGHAAVPPLDVSAGRVQDSPAAETDDAEQVVALRRAEADAFYAALPGHAALAEDARRVQRQALAGLLWSKQFYQFEVEEWLDGDPAGPPPPESRKIGRNADWRHLHNMDVVSMPDKWEYPWYAAWDLAFHCVPLAMVEPEFAKRQLVLILREWYMHPNGQVPAYEWAFGDVNPPVHAWAALRVFEIDRDLTGTADHRFLKRIFHKLLLNFTWWVNRKDADGRNVFQGGFLGLDNIGVFDRSAPLPNGGHLDQADGTAWMGAFCLNMLAISLELAGHDPAYEDVATKFFEHFLWIAAALNNLGGAGIPLWDEDDEFFYDVLQSPSGEIQKLKVRSLVGLMPLLAVETIDADLLARLPHFARRMEWFLNHRPDLASLVSRWHEPGVGERRLLALVRGHRMKRLLKRMLDPDEFLSEYGIRALSRAHLSQPYELNLAGHQYEVRYEPAESSTGLFGGNSNWRGPIWMPINFLIVEALRRFHHYYGDDFLVECPTGSGQQQTLLGISQDISRRLERIFLRDPSGRRPVFGDVAVFQQDPAWRDYVPFYEYFHGDTGRGVGASHQTGWTSLIARLLQQTPVPSSP